LFLFLFKIGKFLSLPIIKFISHFASYLTFILIVITYNLQLVSDGTHLSMFSENFPYFSSNFSAYTDREDLYYVIPFDDFYIRPNFPSSIDIILSIWIIGKFLLFHLFLSAYISHQKFCKVKYGMNLKNFSRLEFTTISTRHLTLSIFFWTFYTSDHLVSNIIQCLLFQINLKKLVKVHFGTK